MEPEAFYDSLSVGIKLQNYFDDFAKGEVQLFCYLACILSLYEGNPTSYWEYDFIKNDLGSPYSEKLDAALDNLIAKDFLVQTKGDFYKLTGTGIELYETYKQFRQNQSRERYLLTSCESLSTIPFGQVREAINNEPILKLSRQVNDKRILNDGDSATIQVLYSQFSNLKMALGSRYKDLVIPAIVWIKYLVENPQNILVQE